jgi:hypothetical protein
MNTEEVEGLVERTGATLTESLKFYWPSSGENDVPEVNISVHFGAVLAASGFLVYADVHDLDNASVRLDVLGLQPETDTLVLAEFKRLWKPETAWAMARDLARIRAWRLAEARARAEFRVAHQFGVLAATTWKQEYVDWFMDSTRALTADPAGGGLAALAAGITGDDARWGSILILKDAPVEIRGPTDEWLVYVVFPL